MGTFRVYYDPAALEELCRRTPYNLKKDLKNIDEQTRQETVSYTHLTLPTTNEV